MTLEEIIETSRDTKEIVGKLKTRQIHLRPWASLIKEYDPLLHPVMDKSRYPDVIMPDKTIDKVTRITYDFQRLATKRMSELCFGIPVKRTYNTGENETQRQIASVMEAIYQRNRIDAVNNERGVGLFASCEIATLWYAVKGANESYGIPMQNKIRCKTFSPMFGDELYPIFDDFGDLTVFSFQTKTETKQIFDVWTDERHIRYEQERKEGKQNGENWEVVTDERHNIGKIPVTYMYRNTPIWEDTSELVFELEWTMSRNGNYLRKNSRPLFIIKSDEVLDYGNEENEKGAFRNIIQLPTNGSAEYCTWTNQVENMKYHVEEIKQIYWTTLQLPDISYDKMKTTPMSGESRKQLFIDAQLKVKDESGRWYEFFDRETNVIKALLSAQFPSWSKEIDALQVQTEITPFKLEDDAEKVTLLLQANGGKPIMSQETSVEKNPLVLDAKKEIELIKASDELDAEREQTQMSNLFTE